MTYDNEYKERAYQYWAKRKDSKSTDFILSSLVLGCLLDAASAILDDPYYKLVKEFDERYESECDTLEKIRKDAFSPKINTCNDEESAIGDWATDLIDRTIKVMERDYGA